MAALGGQGDCMYTCIVHRSAARSAKSTDMIVFPSATTKAINITPICPGHSNIPGNEKAHQLAKKKPLRRGDLLKLHLFHLSSVALGAAKKKASTLDKSGSYKDKTGKFTKTFDKELPGVHTQANLSYVSYSFPPFLVRATNYSLLSECAA